MQEIFYPELDSSQEEAKRLISLGKITEPCLISSDYQSAGRGQRGKTWSSPPGAGVYASLIYPCTQSIIEYFCKDPSSLTINSAEIIRKTLSDCCQKELKLKPLNDIYYAERKLAGILGEIIDSRFIICGFGINLVAVERSFPESENNKVAISLEEIAPEMPELRDLNNFKQSLTSSIAIKLSAYYSSVV